MATWSLRDVTKSFPGVRALRGVSVDVVAGTVHALVGENGCGKSTLIKTFAGVHSADRGEILHDGRPVHLASPQQARRLGVATIYQERSLVGPLTVRENISLGAYPTRARLLDRNEMRRRADAAVELLGIALDLDATVESLSVADQQVVEIAKAVSSRSSLLILDEPTTALSITEVGRLHDLIRRLAGAGTAVLYVSHRLEELADVATEMTVMRDGEVVRRFAEPAPAVGEVVEAMVGRSITQFYSKRSNATEELRLEMRDVRSAGGVRGASLTLHRGEVLGLAGMVGSGRTEIVRALYGVDRVISGHVFLDGEDITDASPRRSIRRGLGYVPESRKSEGLFFNLRASQNLSVAQLKRLLRGPWLSLARERELGAELVRSFKVSAHAEQVAIDQLSGGNQQKLVLARWVFAGSDVLILDEPTQGIDVGAKEEVYRIIDELTSDGVAVILISSDLPELMAMSDRLAIVRRGAVTDVLPGGSLTELQLIDAMSGQPDEREFTHQ